MFYYPCHNFLSYLCSLYFYIFRKLKEKIKRADNISFKCIICFMPKMISGNFLSERKQKTKDGIVAQNIVLNWYQNGWRDEFHSQHCCCCKKSLHAIFVFIPEAVQYRYTIQTHQLFIYTTRKTQFDQIVFILVCSGSKRQLCETRKKREQVT